MNRHTRTADSTFLTATPYTTESDPGGDPDESRCALTRLRMLVPATPGLALAAACRVRPAVRLLPCLVP